MEDELFGEATRLAKNINKKNEHLIDKEIIAASQAIKYDNKADDTNDISDKKRYADLRDQNVDRLEKYKNQRELIDDTDSIRHTDKNPRWIKKDGRKCKDAQRKEYDLYPSSKALENKQPGKYKAMQDAKRNKK